jgi:DNA-binding LacI/PurR family transcriptional regulator
MLLKPGSRTGTSIYLALAARLRASIREGRWAPGQQIGSEHDLARREGISRMTVRKASELLIREGLLQRRPGKGLFVRAAPGVDGGPVQVVVGNLTWETSLQMARGVQDAVKGDGIHAQIYDARGDIDLDLRVIESLPIGPARGAVIVSLHSPRFSRAICRLHAAGFPFVLLDQKMTDIDVPSVTADNHAGGRLVADHLIGFGHRRIAFLGDLIAGTVRDRLAGLRDALGEADLPFRPSLVVDLAVMPDNRFGDWTAEVAAGVRRLMAEPAPPTAIFCSCDGVARRAYRELAALGLRVPDDVSVVGFDDDPIADYVHPRLTSVRQPFHAMGVAAMDLLRRQIATPAEPPPSLTLPVQLIERDSVAPPRC